MAESGTHGDYLGGKLINDPQGHLTRGPEPKQVWELAEEAGKMVSKPLASDELKIKRPRG